MQRVLGIDDQGQVRQGGDDLQLTVAFAQGPSLPIRRCRQGNFRLGFRRLNGAEPQIAVKKLQPQAQVAEGKKPGFVIG